MNHLKVRALCEGAIMVALATVLSYLKLFELPQGGAISIGMLPVLFYCCRWGLKDGLLCAFAYGLLQLMFDGAYAWGWTSMSPTPPRTQFIPDSTPDINPFIIVLPRSFHH